MKAGESTGWEGEIQKITDYCKLHRKSWPGGWHCFFFPLWTSTRKTATALKAVLQKQFLQIHIWFWTLETQLYFTWFQKAQLIVSYHIFNFHSLSCNLLSQTASQVPNHGMKGHWEGLVMRGRSRKHQSLCQACFKGMLDSTSSGLEEYFGDAWEQNLHCLHSGYFSCVVQKNRKHGEAFSFPCFISFCNVCTIS